MAPLYAFTCADGHQTEKLVAGYDCASVSCRCGKTASRAQVNRIGVSGLAIIPRDHRNYRQSYREFEEARAEVGYAYGQREKAGEPVQMPDYAAIAQANVAANGG